MDFTFCSNQEVHIHVKVLNKVNTFYILTIERFSIEWKDYVRNWMKLMKNNGMWCFSADKEHTPLIIFCMKTVTSQLSFPKLLVPVSATRARIDLEVLYLTLKYRNHIVMLVNLQNSVKNNTKTPWKHKMTDSSRYPLSWLHVYNYRAAKVAHA